MVRLAPSTVAPVLVLGIALAACSTPASPSVSIFPTGGVSPSSMAPSAGPDAARADLDHLLERLESVHPEPFHGVPRGEWVAALDDLKGRLDELTPQQAEVELMRVMALLSREGRDGHQFALPIADGPVLPIRVYEFDDGVWVTDALAPHEDLVGTRLVALGEHPVDDVLAALEPLVPRDGPATVPNFRPVFLLRTSVLRGLGLIGDGNLEVTVAGADGTERTASLAPVPFDDWVAWGGQLGMIRLPGRTDTLYLGDLEDHFWTRYLPDTRTLYVRLAEVQRVDAAEVSAMVERAGQPDVDRVVVDLRQNPGGDNTTYPGLLAALRDPAVDRPGRFFVLIDHVTFSAAANLATELEQSTGAIFAGQAMGGGLNFWDDVQWVTLPSYPVPMQVGVSTRYWQKATPGDPRLTIEPDIAVPSRASDYFAGRDPVLEAVLATTPD